MNVVLIYFSMPSSISLLDIWQMVYSPIGGHLVCFCLGNYE
jgi:hypothetical protein